ncbi:MAG: hypothetical protein HY231_11680 [Acidobacteria bacterium]|nr:hypothetical protein [Acidobacteriota bacterium]
MATSVPSFGSQTGIIAQHLKRCNRNLKIINLAIMLALVGLFLFNGKYLYNLFTGPATLDDQALAKLRSAGEVWANFVKVPGNNSSETGLAYMEVKTRHGVKVSEEMKARYVVIGVDDKTLLVKAAPDDKGIYFSGEIVDMPTFEQQQILPELLRKEPEIRGNLLPVMLDATNYRRSGVIGLAIGVPLFILGLWNLQKALARSRAPHQHPLMRSLARFGTPDLIAANIDADIRTNLYAADLKTVLVTSSWLLVPRAFTVDILSINEIVWVYKKVTKHSYNFIPTGKTYATMIGDRRGKILEVSSNRNESNTEALVDRLAHQAPWVLFGYDQEIAQVWQTNAGSLIQTVEARRRQYESQSVGA